MRLPVVRLGLLSAAAVLLLRGGCAGKTNGSLCYYYLEVSEPSQEQPQFFIRSYLDDQPIARYNNLTRKMEPLVSWVEEVEKEGFLAPKRVFNADLKKLSKLDHSTEGLHTWQAILGCELREDGSKGRFFRYGYNGTDFITFENETLKWMAPQPQAEKIKQTLEENPQWSRRNKDYLEKICIEWLQRYLSYRNKTLECTEPPKGKLTLKVVNDSQELICQGFGFYSKEIQANWTRDGEVSQNETVPRNMTPNSDGTYYVRLSIEIDPKEKDRFQCHLNCEGLPEPLVLAWKEETANSVGLVVKGSWLQSVVVVFLIVAVIYYDAISVRTMGREISTTSPLFEMRPVLRDQDQRQQSQDQRQQDQDQRQQRIMMEDDQRTRMMDRSLGPSWNSY